MQVTRERVGSVIGGSAMAAALAFFTLTHEPPPAPAQVGEQVTLNIPTIEQMCASLGATDPQSLMECQAVESSAGEYVVAWMGLNGFILYGGIDIEQIQLIASLDDSNTVDPFLTFDPTLDQGLPLDPSLDPSLGGDLGLGGVTNPLTGETSPPFASPAQLAMFCLGGAVDWISLQDCISMNDPTIQLEAAR